MSLHRKISSTNFQNEQAIKIECPMQYAIQRIGGRWKMIILWYIHVGTNRFSLLQRHIPNVSRKMLTQQLQELQADDLIVRIVISERPTHIEYSLTERAKPLIPILSALNTWATQETIEQESYPTCS